MIQVFEGDGEDQSLIGRTERETEILASIRTGHATFKEIRDHLGVSFRPYGWRALDRSLQRMRKDGIIRFHPGHRCWVIGS